MTDRWDPPVGFISFLSPREDRAGRAPVMIAGARELHLSRSAHRNDQEARPLPLDGESIAEKLEFERGIAHGGRGPRASGVFLLWWP